MSLMKHVYGFYHEELPLEEQVRAMKIVGQASRYIPVSCAIAVVLQCGICVLRKWMSPPDRCGAVLREAFLELKSMRRAELLEMKCCCEGLFKMSADPVGSTYELRLVG